MMEGQLGQNMKHSGSQYLSHQLYIHNAQHNILELMMKPRTTVSTLEDTVALQGTACLVITASMVQSSPHGTETIKTNVLKNMKEPGGRSSKLHNC